MKLGCNPVTVRSRIHKFLIMICSYLVRSMDETVQ